MDIEQLAKKAASIHLQKEANWGRLTSTVARAALPQAKSLTRGLWSTGRQAFKGLGTAAKGMRFGPGQAVRSAQSALGNVAKATPAQAKKTLRFAAGAPEEEAIFSGGLKDSAIQARNLLFSPRWRGLHRPLTRNPSGALEAVKGGRQLDFSRQLAGEALRRAPQAATLGSLAHAAHLAAQSRNEPWMLPASSALAEATDMPGYFRQAARQEAQRVGPPTSPEYQKAFSEAYENLRRQWYNTAAKSEAEMFSNLARRAAAGQTDPFEAAALSYTRKAAVPTLRHAMHQWRSQHPTRAAAADTIRSLSPAGMLATLGLRSMPRREPPDQARILKEVIQENAEPVLEGLSRLPENKIYQWARDIAPDEAIRRLVRNKSQDAEQGARQQAADTPNRLSPFASTPAYQAQTGGQEPPLMVSKDVIEGLIRDEIAKLRTDQERTDSWDSLGWASRWPYLQWMMRQGVKLK